MTSSITTWNRLEPLPIQDDLGPGLRAEIADPLWALSQQYRVGEMRGEDAGSPIEARISATTARLTRYHAGPMGTRAVSGSVDLDPAVPLETVVECEPVWGAVGDGRLRARAGLHFLRLLAAHGAGSQGTGFVDEFGFDGSTLVGDDQATARLRRTAVGRVPDGLALRRAFREGVDEGGAVVTLPAAPDVGADASRVRLAATAYLRWMAGFVIEPADGDDAWVSEHLEHEFAVQAELPGARVTLRAEEYQGGRLDWHDFTVDGARSLGSGQGGSRSITRTLLPTPATYGGMPADRWWAFEDATVRFGGLAGGRTDLARLLLSEFALIYSNDWFVVPVDLPVGSVARVDTLVVTDSFGVRTTIAPVVDPGWSMFRLSGSTGAVASITILPPTLLETQESPAMEEVLFTRDEMANIVWAIERSHAGDGGRAIDSYEEQQRQLTVGQRQLIPTDIGDAELVYRLQSRVPDHWHPLVPVVDPQYRLERRAVQRLDADGGLSVLPPRGRILTAAEPFRVDEAEVPRSGALVTRNFQLTRWTDGRLLVWSGRRKRVGRGEGSSGLRYDSATEVRAESTRPTP